MTIARSQQVDSTLARWYHCISRCVRGALLLRDGAFNRKEWIESRIEELARIFAVGVGGFSVMDNPLHLPSVAGPLARRWLIDTNWPV